MRQYKAFIVGGGYSEESLFKKYGWGISQSIEGSDLVVFTGGEDINPAIYQQHKHPLTWYNEDRDARELLAYQLAQDKGKRMAGICRGAQLLNALMGGSMHQHVDNHSGIHMAYDSLTGEEMMVNSVHHQIMIPNLERGYVVMEATECTSRQRCSKLDDKFEIIREVVDFTDTTTVRDVEAVCYPDDGIFGIQAHPEYCVHPNSRVQVDKIFMGYLEEIFEFKRLQAA